MLELVLFPLLTAICHIIVLHASLSYNICSNKNTLPENSNTPDLGVDGGEQVDVSANTSHVIANYATFPGHEPPVPLHLPTQPAYHVMVSPISGESPTDTVTSPLIDSASPGNVGTGKLIKF